MDGTLEEEILFAKARAYATGMNDERESIIHFLTNYEQRNGTLAHAIAILSKDENGACPTCGYDCPEGWYS